MATSTIHEAKTNLSKLIERAERGEEVLIARGKKVVARIISVSSSPKTRRLDLLRGKFKLTSKFFEPLPDDELDAWNR